MDFEDVPREGLIIVTHVNSENNSPVIGTIWELYCHPHCGKQPY